MNRHVDRISGAIVGIGVLAATSRRWSAVLMASALGMGLFIGVAFGPAIDRIGAIGGQVVALDTAAPAAEPASVTDEAPASSSSSSSPDGVSDDTTTPLDAAPAPYIPPAPAPYIPPEEPPPLPPSDVPPPGDPGDDPEATFAGTVVHVNPLAGSYTLAVRGELYAVHAKGLPDPGQKLEVALSELANGTYEEDGERSEEGEAGRGTVNGFVTWVRDDGREPAYTVSMRGVSLLVTVPPEDEAELPARGEFVSAEVAIEDPPPAEEVQRLRRRARQAVAPGLPPAPVGQPPGNEASSDSSCTRAEPVRYVAPRATLVQTSVEPSGDAYDYFDLAGYVQAACADGGELVLSADDIRASEADIVLTAPKGIELGELEPDSPVLATAEVGEQGELALAGLADDDGVAGADDEDRLQGDLGG